MNLNRSIKPDLTTEAPLLGRCCYALFFLGIKGCVAILIPKKKDIGYLKSPFGGHYAGAKYKEFCQLNLTYAGDDFDIYGHLFIGIGLNSWDNDYDAAVKEIMDGVVSLFPQCCGYKEIDSPTFWSHVK